MFLDSSKELKSHRCIYSLYKASVLPISRTDGSTSMEPPWPATSLLLSAPEYKCFTTVPSPLTQVNFLLSRVDSGRKPGTHKSHSLTHSSLQQRTERQKREHLSKGSWVRITTRRDHSPNIIKGEIGST